MRKKRLPWTLHYLGHAPMPTIIHSPFSFVQTVSPCVKPSYHHILERSPFAIPSVPFHLQSLSSGSLTIHLFQATISQTKQPKKSPSSPQMHHFPSIYLSISIQIISKTIRDAPPTHERVAAVYKLRNVPRDVKQITNSRDDVLIARLRSGHQPSLKQYLHRLDPSQDPICPNCHEEEQDLVHWLYNCPALLSARQRVPSRFIRVACHPTWGCRGVRKEDPGQPCRLTH